MPGYATYRKNMYYSFNVGAVHFTGVNSESPIDLAEIGPRQVSWIEHDLGSNTAARAPANAAAAATASANWTVVYSHRPFYCSNTRGNDILKGNAVLQKELEGVLLKNKVDLVVSG